MRDSWFLFARDVRKLVMDFLSKFKLKYKTPHCHYNLQKGLNIMAVTGLLLEELPS
jgi:hypothetical protein